MTHVIVALVAGILFGLGLAVSGMTSPHVVIGFLDVTGDWNPALLFVMAGAIAIHAVAYRALRGRPSPVLAPSFQVPKPANVDARLIVGSAIFGVGWGLAGYCPGPALVSLVGLGSSAFVMVVSMVAGMFLHFLTMGRSTESAIPQKGPPKQTEAELADA